MAEKLQIDAPAELDITTAPDESPDAADLSSPRSLLDRLRSRSALLVGFGTLALVGAGVSKAALETHQTRSATTELAATNHNHEQFASKPSWSQDFSKMPDGPLSPAKWHFVIGPAARFSGNGDKEFYRKKPANARVEDGALVLEAQKQNFKGYNYTSARIQTQDTLDFKYGKLDVVAKTPKGRGSWPAIWMLSSDHKYTKHAHNTHEDPYFWLRDGEIDLLEAVGMQPGVYETVAQSYEYHWPKSRFAYVKDPSISDKFHEYSLEWTPKKLVFLLDNKPVYEVDKHKGDTFKQWPYDQRFHLVMDLAVGGSWAGQRGIDNTSLPWEMKIKSVNYYKYISGKQTEHKKHKHTR